MVPVIGRVDPADSFEYPAALGNDNVGGSSRATNSGDRSSDAVRIIFILLLIRALDDGDEDGGVPIIML